MATLPLDAATRHGRLSTKKCVREDGLLFRLGPGRQSKQQPIRRRNRAGHSAMATATHRPYQAKLADILTHGRHGMPERSGGERAAAEQDQSFLRF